MNLDPIDILGETIGSPLKRGFLYFLGLVTGGWMGSICLNIDRSDWRVFGWYDFTGGFLHPVAMLFSSAGPLVVAGLLYFLITSWRLAWSWLPVVAGGAAFGVAGHDAELGWVAWFVLSMGLAGVIWLWNTYQKTRWALELAELSAHNSLQSAIRKQAREAAVAEAAVTTDGNSEGNPAPDKATDDTRL